MEDLINKRCGWAGTDELYIKYHDEEWSEPASDDKTLFEFLGNLQIVNRSHYKNISKWKMFNVSCNDNITFM